jgi:hypothetical protein
MGVLFVTKYVCEDVDGDYYRAIEFAVILAAICIGSWAQEAMRL